MTKGPGPKPVGLVEPRLTPGAKPRDSPPPGLRRARGLWSLDMGHSLVIGSLGTGHFPAWPSPQNSGKPNSGHDHPSVWKALSNFGHDLPNVRKALSNFRHDLTNVWKALSDFGHNRPNVWMAVAAHPLGSREGTTTKPPPRGRKPTFWQTPSRPSRSARRAWDAGR